MSIFFTAHHKKGHTLIEIMVAVVICGFLLSALFSVFIPGLKIFMIGKTRAEVQSEVLVSLRRMRVELSSSSNASVTINSGEIYDVSGTPHAISFLSPYRDSGSKRIIALDDDSCTTPIWQKYVLYYFDKTSGELRRKEKTYDKVSGDARKVPFPLTHSELLNFCNDNNIKYTVISRNIHTIGMYRTSPSLIKIEICARKKGTGITGSSNEEMKSFIEIYPHNTLGI
jgi:type II secretory pathway pseudopilin PulG